MSSETQIRTLISEIEKGCTVLGRITDFYEGYIAQTQNARDRTPEQAIVLADVFASYYTCLETIFLRISQFFENSLAADRWHQDLLHKMTLRIESVREAVLAEATAASLQELLKFRHFKRDYFEFEYDWDRLEFVRKKFDQVRPLVRTDLNRFLGFLRDMLVVEADSAGSADASQPQRGPGSEVRGSSAES